MSAKIEHEAVVELFRFDGLLLKELFGERFGLAALEPKVETPELTQLPVQYRADSVTVFRDGGRRGALRHGRRGPALARR